MKNNKDPFISQIIISFKRMSKKYQGYSWRRLAKRIGVSHAFLLYVIKGVRKFPAEKMDNLVEALELDDFAVKRLVDSYLETHFKLIEASSKVISKHMNLNELNSKIKEKSSTFEELPLNKINLFKPWFNAALLDLIETKDFKPHPKLVAQRLSITEKQAEDAFTFLKSEGLIEVGSDGVWRKSQQYVRVPSNAQAPAPAMKDFYNELFHKASAQMRKPYDEEEHKKRLILGVTCSVNSNKWESMKLKLTDQLFFNAETLAEGDCDQVYCLMTVAIPLSK